MNDGHDYTVHYKKWHDGSDADYDNAAAFYGRVLAEPLSGLGTGVRILDVGCGTGLLVNALLKRGYEHVVGVDTSEAQIACAIQRGLPCRHVGENWLFAEGIERPGTYDAVFLLDVLEHVPIHQQLAFVRAITTLLSDDSILVVTVPNANSAISARMRYIDWTHTTAFTEHSLDYVLLNAGFATVQHLSYEFHARPRLPWVPRPGVMRWAIWRAFRMLRRLEAYAELGKEGWGVPLGPNLLAVATKGTRGPIV
jgi:SAM-dependent methyltransferase